MRVRMYCRNYGMRVYKPLQRARIYPFYSSDVRCGGCKHRCVCPPGTEKDDELELHNVKPDKKR